MFETQNTIVYLHKFYVNFDKKEKKFERDS